VKLGQINKLRIQRETGIGLFLSDDKGAEVLLPKRYTAQRYTLGDTIEVFVYNDSEDRLIATTETPLATTGSFAFLEVVDTGYTGAFLHWGLMKDLLVPMKQQRTPMRVGRKYLVYVYEDELTHRLAATSRLEKVLSKEPDDIAPGDEVRLIVWLRTGIGFNVIVNEKYLGMIYHNQLYREIAEGEHLRGFVQQIREDGKIDILLQQPGVANIEPAAEKLWQKLLENNGFLKLSDASSPEEIASLLQMSKKAFKRALGSLYKQRKVTIEPEGIRLIQS